MFIWVGQPLTLRISTRETVLLTHTLLVSTLTLSQGRTTVLYVVPFAAYLFLSVTH